MSLQYEVRNPFTTAGKTFLVGATVSAKEVNKWDAETVRNRVLHGDIVPVKVEDKQVEESTANDEKSEENKTSPRSQ